MIGKRGRADYELLRKIQVGNAPRGAVKLTDDGRGFVSNTSQNTISEIDPINLEEVRRITVGFGPRGLGIVPGNRYILVSNSGSDTVSIVDLHANEEVRQIPTGRDPRHMAITADGRYAYICIWGADVVVRLNLAGLGTDDLDSVGIETEFDMGETAHPYSAAIDPSGRFVFVANTQAPYVSVIDRVTEQVAKVDVGDIGGRAVAFSADGRYALASIETTSKVAVIDIDRLQVTRQIPVGPGPRGIAVDDDEILYVTNFARTNPGWIKHDELPGGPNMLTAVHLGSASLAEDVGSFSYQAIEVGYGPCSVSVVDTARLRSRTEVAAGATSGR
ncbi:MAG: beta-propeller fold lactonase family protein [Micropruina sp.]|uniref:YncE family protein n=1 Tax=Micropruina sp. TaxID=2737536 RepID=UPI0039E65828